MASNRANLADVDGSYSDWIELHNPDEVAVDLRGWYLTDSATTRTKWQFPAVAIPAGGYLVVFASNKNRSDPDAELHTNFALSAGGEYLGLIKPDGTTVAFEYAPQFPAQTDDVSYGIRPIAGGGLGERTFFQAPTPGKSNFIPAAATPTEKVAFSRASGLFTTEFPLQLSGASAGQVIRFVASAPSTNGEGIPEPTADSPEFTAPLQIDRSTVVRAAVFTPDGSLHGAISTAYFARIAASAATFSSKLPLVVIDSLGTGPLVKDGVDHPSWMYVYGARGGGTAVFDSAPELVTPLTATVRGTSSSDFPKKGYNLKLTDENGRKRPQALLGLPAHEKWALVAPWKFDPGIINNSFVYALSNSLGRWAPRTRIAEVFFNADGDEVTADDYAGIYVMTDRIEIGPARVAIPALAPGDGSGPALTGGYLIKIDSPDWDEFSWTTERGIPTEPFTAIVLVAPKADEVSPAQCNYLIDYVQQMENALFVDRESGFARRTYLDYIDRASWVDHHLLNTLVANPDAFERSAYFTKPREGKLQAGPVWDFDRALGSLADERSLRWDVWSDYGAADVWRIGWWGAIARDPEFMQDWIDRWQALRRTTLSSPALLALVESQASEIGTAAAARDAARWPENTSPIGGFNAQIEHLKGWLTNRAQWIDGQFVPPPTVTTVGGTLVFTAPAGAQLAYTLDGSDPRSLGGETAPNTLVSPAPVTVPANSNMHARSYRADLTRVFPGSPWSSSVGGTNSSPLAPTARIVNLSTRAMIGSGENTMLIGVVVADTNAKRFLSRAVGPGLAAFGVEGFVPDPQLSIISANGTELFRNGGWEDGVDAALIPAYSRSVGAFPLAAGTRDAALAASLPAGAYTIQVATPTDQTGVGLVEIYELDGNGRTVNLSGRALVQAGDGVLIGGLVIKGPAYKRMLVRAVGPGLAALGVTNALADPVLTIYSGANTLASNDQWESSANATAIRSASSSVGAFELAAGSDDAALLITLPPGAYTVEVKGKGESEGVALLEIYEVP